MANRSMTDVAYEFLSKRKRSVEFLRLWGEVNSVLKFPEAQVRNKSSVVFTINDRQQVCIIR